MELTIAGRYMVYAPTGEGVGVSRRLDDKERDRLRKEAKQLDLGGGGAIIRTAAHGAKRADFERELQYLFKLNEVLQKRVEETTAPGHGLPGGRPLGPRRARHLLRALRARDRRRPQAAPPARLVLHAHRAGARRPRRAVGGADGTLFEAFGVEEVIEGMLSRRVDLPSGGYLMIDYAEALTVIDVNTGSFTGRGKAARLEDTITKTNLEAAEEVVNQLRLRDIGGIIVIDFIDMARARNRDAVLKTLRKALDEDRTKTFVVEISPLGLVEMTRQNVTDGVREIMTKPCPTCDGEGVSSPRRRSRSRSSASCASWSPRPARQAPRPTSCSINPRVTALVHRRRRAQRCTRSRRRPASWFHFEGSEGLPLDHFAVTQEGTRDEIEERRVPFRAGDEVHVHIVEPHMYNDDDAVAKIDGYMIAVADGGRLRGREEARAHRGGGAHAGPRGAGRRRGRGGRRGRQGGAKARQGAARRKPRAAAKPAAKPAPKATRARRRGRERAAGRGGRRRRRDARIEASAPRPQRRTAPFACEGRSQRVI